MIDVATPLGAVVIVTYNADRHIRSCLASLSPDRDAWQVVVVDSGSKDETVRIAAAEFPWVRLVEAGSNIGYSAGNNTGVAVTDAPLLFFLNPDTVVGKGALDKLVAAIHETGAAAVAPRLNGLDGRYQSEGAELRLPTFAYMSLEAVLIHRVWPRTRHNAVLSDWNPDKPRLLQRPSTAAFLMRRDVFAALGGFDERFRPAWFEDIDLCKRIIDSGETIHYVPDAVITHVGRSTIPLFSTVSVLAMWDANRLRYTRKHFSPWQAAVMRGLTIFGTLLRGVVRAVNPRTATSLPSHLWLAWRMARYSDESKWYP